ncbi:hypothetical protein MMC10_004845 [Thelotrema lepadinum]|nr:hypothetical protein [Thelotrema lepadinum]
MLLQIIGLLHILFFFIIRHEYSKYFSSPKLHIFAQENPRTWALVTGASDGLGFGFCQELAARGFNLILHGKDFPSLDAASTRLTAEFPALGIRLFIADATEPLPSFDELLAIVSDIPLTVLVNNVGGSSNLASPFAYLDYRTPEEITGTINLNLGFTTRITSVLLPSLTAHRRPSLILNIGSLAAPGMPRLTIYSAAKAYLKSFSQGLSTELGMQKKDVTVHYIGVGETQTQEVRLPTSLLVPSARKMAAATLRCVGSGGVALTPYWPHRAMEWMGVLMPRWVVRPLTVRGVRMMEAEFKKWR